jgi:PiT family inorganic phosphate transporter
MTAEIQILLVIVITAALLFALTNGLHDASSVVATFIACGAATPGQAVGLAAVFGFIGAMLGGSAVANTFSSLVSVSIQHSLLVIILAAVLAAVTWNLITWYFGIPSSSTHALVGGIIGAVWVSNGFHQVLWGWSQLFGEQHELTGMMRVFAALLISPPLGFILAYLLQKLLSFALRNARNTVNRWLKGLQWVMEALLAFSFGANDTQKIMGLITLALIASGNLQQQAVPLWVRLICALVMFCGTLFGGWTIMRTLGERIYEIRPIHSLNSQVSSGTAILLATHFGTPVSTTHVMASSVLGVGAGDEHRMVNWNIGKEMIIAWFVTIPCAVLVAALIYYPVNWLAGQP